MANCYLWLDTRRAKKDGRFPVKVAVAYGTDLYIDTGISVDRVFWDSKNELYLGQEAKRVNRELGATLEHISARVVELRASGQFDNLTKQDLKKLLIAYKVNPETVKVFGKYPIS